MHGVGEDVFLEVLGQVERHLPEDDVKEGGAGEFYDLAQAFSGVVAGGLLFFL